VRGTPLSRDAGGGHWRAIGGVERSRWIARWRISVWAIAAHSLYRFKGGNDVSPHPSATVDDHFDDHFGGKGRQASGLMGPRATKKRIVARFAGGRGTPQEWARQTGGQVVGGSNPLAPTKRETAAEHERTGGGTLCRPPFFHMSDANSVPFTRRAEPAVLSIQGLFGVLARVARLRGYDPTFSKYTRNADGTHTQRRPPGAVNRGQTRWRRARRERGVPRRAARHALHSASPEKGPPEAAS